MYEFRFGGELKSRPSPDATQDEWTRYVYAHKNEAGVQTEWWYHGHGCRQWFLARRNTVSNMVLESFQAEDDMNEASAAGERTD